MIPHYDEIENGFIRLRATKGVFHAKLKYSNRLNDYGFVGGIIEAVHPFGLPATISWNYTPDGFGITNLATNVHDIDPDYVSILETAWQHLDWLC